MKINDFMGKFFFAEEFGKAFVPRRFRAGLRGYLFKAGIYSEPYKAFGILFYLAYAITFVIYFKTDMYKSIAIQSSLFMSFFEAFIIWLIFPLAIVGLFMMFIYFFIDIRVFNRTKKLEEILPDFLAVVSSNLKGGLSFENSLWLAIKPQFGILADEISIAAKKVMTGHDVDQALTEFTDKYDSPMLKRTIALIVGELSSGGKIANILDNIVASMKKQKELKDEMNASVISYMIFISAIVIFIAPVLFALSLNLLSVIQGVTGLLSGAGGGSGSPKLLGNVTEVSVDKDMFVNFSRLAIGVISLFASMIVSILEKGNIKAGVKYIPIFLISSQVFYQICLSLFGLLFGSMIKF
ncbi:type II secretion system F family protein [Candidatus Woesearchaeota archaeon]|nr:type II secretion system F family protein [Candidatus Woesearchaeota archaeon]